MNNVPNREVAIFSAALELDASQRAAYLDTACSDDPDLRQRLEALLGVHQKAITFLENPTPEAQAVSKGAGLPGVDGRSSSSLSEKAGDRIGRYKLLQQIGEGGCGVVYMAEQEEPVRRRVALKIIKLGMDTKQVIARFEAERQALALMDHPNIAKIFDAGVTDAGARSFSSAEVRERSSQPPLAGETAAAEDSRAPYLSAGRPFFVMELVRGVKITDYCDEHNLSTEERLKLFTQVCQAIQHAHQKGIIHRDIKPSNILVTITEPGAPGCPKVIDFGIAKATTGQPLTDRTVFTAFEQFIGTPAYMSPEQAMMTSLDIDTRTDIYSLGVLLYELLTGRTPFDTKDLLAGGLDAMRRIIREQEPVRPSTRLSTMLAGELTTTAMHRRIEPPKLVHLLRGDLDWIVMKALEKDRARRYETANGLARDVERYLADEPVVARPPSGAYRFQKLVRRNQGIFASGLVLGLMLVLAVVVSTWQAVRASRAEHAQERLRLQAQAEAGLLKTMLRSIGPSVAKGRSTELMQDILDQTVSSIRKDLTNQPEVEVDLSLNLAEAYRDLGRYQQMEDLARHSLQVARTRLGDNNESVVNSLLTLGSCLLTRGQLHLGEFYAGNVPQEEKNRRLQDSNLQEALKCANEALALNRKLFGNENLKVAAALNLQASIVGTQYQMAECEALKREALAIYRRLNNQPKVAAVLRQIAFLLGTGDERLAEAEDLNREALALQRKLLGNDDPEIAISLSSLGTVLRRRGKWADAESTYLEELALWTKLQATNRFEIADTRNYLGEVLVYQGKWENAEIQYRTAFAISSNLFGKEHLGTAVAQCRLADVLQRQGKLDEAEPLAREAFVSSRKLLEQGNLLAAEPLYTLVNVLLVRRKEAEAEQLLSDLLKPAPPGKPQNVGVLRVQAVFFARGRKWKQAAANFAKLVELDPSIEDDQLSLTILLLEMGNMPKYRAQCQKMVTSFGGAKLGGPLSKTAQACLLMAEAGSDSATTRQLADRAFTFGKDSFWLYYLQYIKGLAQFRAGDFASSVDWLAKTIGHPAMVGGAQPDAAAYAILAMAQHKLKRSDEARAALEKSVGIINTKLPKLENGALDEYWLDWLIAQTLVREAQALLGGQGDPLSNQPK